MSLDLASISSDYDPTFDCMTDGELVQYDANIRYVCCEVKNDKLEAIATLVTSVVFLILGAVTCFTPFTIGGLIMVLLSVVGLSLSAKQLSTLNEQQNLCQHALKNVQAHLTKRSI